MRRARQPEPDPDGQHVLIPAPKPVPRPEPPVDAGAGAAVRRRQHDPVPQLSLFGIEARPPSPVDLEGLLAGAGQVTRMGGTARVSIVVEDRWRARVLLAECALRGLTGVVEPSSVEGHLAFRTAYSAALAPLGARWLRGAVKAPPPGFFLDGRRLRLWVAAAGSADGGQAYVLRLGPATPGGAAPSSRMAEDADPVWVAVGSALDAAGLSGTLLGPRGGGPAYRINGRKRVARLAEMIGDPPREVPPDVWPR